MSAKLSESEAKKLVSKFVKVLSGCQCVEDPCPCACHQPFEQKMVDPVKAFAESGVPFFGMDAHSAGKRFEKK